MCRRLVSLVSLILIMGLAGYVLAQEPDTEIPDTGGTTPVLDGIMDEIWSLSAENIMTMSIEGAVPDSASDCSGSWWALWDWDNLYILIDVNDEELVQDSGATEGWNDDRVEIFIDGDNGKDAATDGVNDYQYNFRWNNGEVETPVEWYFLDSGIDKLEGVEYGVATTEHGYLVEVALPWATLTGEPPLPGQLIGIEILIDDDDDGGGRDTQFGWYISESGDPHNPSRWGTAMFILLSSDKAFHPGPRDNGTDVPRDTGLSWMAGDYADTHDLYFGTDLNDVNEASISDSRGVLIGQGLVETSYELAEPLDFGRTYYWRVDEINDTEPNSPWKGDVWSFTVINYHVVDDFEDYNDYPPDRIFDTWMDGYNTTTNGSTAGYPEPDFNAGEHFIETNIKHGGYQSMPFFYDNNMKYSEVSRPLDSLRDWTIDGVQALSLWFRGYPAYSGSFIEEPAGTYTMTGSGADIWGNTDEFHFAYRELSSPGSIIAKVESVEETDAWAKGGVMIRDSLEADSIHAMMVVSATQGVSFQYRTSTGGTSLSTDIADVNAPQWVKIERDIGGNVTASYSADGSSWTLVDSERFTMNIPMYIGLAVTSHNSTEVCEAVFSNISVTGTVSDQWTNQDIGILSNSPQPMYVGLSNSAGEPVFVYHEDTGVTAQDMWTQWIIDLQDFASEGIDLTDVDSMSIGIGTSGDTTTNGGSGVVFIDDIRLYLLSLSE